MPSWLPVSDYGSLPEEEYIHTSHKIHVQKRDRSEVCCIWHWKVCVKFGVQHCAFVSFLTQTSCVNLDTASGASVQSEPYFTSFPTGGKLPLMWRHTRTHTHIPTYPHTYILTTKTLKTLHSVQGYASYNCTSTSTNRRSSHQYMNIVLYRVKTFGAVLGETWWK